MHSIERELIKATNYKARAKFDDRQDYLKSILNAVAKLTDDDFDSLSDDTATWTNAAVEAHNSKKEIPDFDELEPDDEEDDTDEAEDEGEDTEADSDPEAVKATDVSDDDDSDSDDEEADEDEPEDEDDPADDDEAEAEPDEDDEPPAKPAKGKKAPAKKAKAEPAPKPAKPTKPVVAKKITRDVRNDPEVELDKWNCMDGSKNARAMAMFEKGATTKEVRDAIGGTYYNMLKKQVEAGHSLTKEGSLIRLTHKDNMGKKSAVVKKKK